MSNALAVTKSQQYLVMHRQLCCVWDAPQCCVSLQVARPGSLKGVPSGGSSIKHSVCEQQKKKGRTRTTAGCHEDFLQGLAETPANVLDVLHLNCFVACWYK